MMMLDALGLKHGTDKASSGMGYLERYEQYLAPIRNNHVTVLEIGVYNGASLGLWSEYFSNNKTRIYGLDVMDKAQYDSKRVKTVIGSQSSRPDLRRLVKRVPHFDLIIDDGGHTMKQQQVSLGFLFWYLAPGGLYVIEDLVTSSRDYEPKAYNPTSTRNTTAELVRKLAAGKGIASDWLTKPETLYLERNVKWCKIESGRGSDLAFIQKR